MRRTVRMRKPLFDVMAVGNVNVDLTVSLPRPPGPDEKLVADRCRLCLGGAATNFSIACARLGLATGLIAVVGDDALGRMALRALKAEGIDISYIKRAHEALTGLALVLEMGETRGLVSCRGANDLLSPSDVGPDRVSRAKMVLGASIRLEVAKALASACLEAQRPLVLDPGGTLASHGLRELEPVLKATYVFTPNRVELFRITGLREFKKAIEVAWSSGPELVVVKAGKDGCFVFDGSSLEHLEAIKPMGRVVDPTGAGDAFNAGLVLGLLKGLKPARAAELGMAVATLKLGRAGASNMPTLKELKALLSSRPGFSGILKVL